MLQQTILVVEDEATIAMTIADALRAQGFATLVAADLPQADSLLQQHRLQAVILDRMLPSGDGVAWLQGRRAAGCELPVLILSARCDENARCLGLESGADDYLPKPFSPRELVARISALLRRAPVAAARRFCLAGVTVDLDARLAGDHTLSDHEFALVSWCYQHAGRTVSREELLREVWGFAQGPVERSRAVDMCVAGLRKKLGAAAGCLATVRGGGYRLDVDGH